jgi:hypothetical protein
MRVLLSAHPFFNCRNFVRTGLKVPANGELFEVRKIVDEFVALHPRRGILQIPAGIRGLFNSFLAFIFGVQTRYQSEKEEKCELAEVS